MIYMRNTVLSHMDKRKKLAISLELQVAPKLVFIGRKIYVGEKNICPFAKSVIDVCAH